MENFLHPWIYLAEEIKKRGRTQKYFSELISKPNSEINELIKWKRNITVQWDIILTSYLDTPPKKWIQMQIDYEYNQHKWQQQKQAPIKQEPREKKDDSSEKNRSHDKEKEKIFRNF